VFKRILQILEAFALYIILILVRIIPLKAASALGGMLARTFGPFLRSHRTALKNLHHAFPEKTDQERANIVQGMWDNLGRTAFEYPHLGSFRFREPTDTDSTATVEIVGAEHIVKLRDDNKAGLFVSGHFANWEIPALGVIHNGVPIHLIYRAPNNPYLENVFRHRQLGHGGLRPMGAEGARRAVKLLNAGEHIGMLVDQKMNDGIAVPFFGRDAMTAPALAQFALKYDVPVVPVHIERLKGIHFRITCYPPIPIRKTANRQLDILAAMTNVNKILESWIRKRPEQWLWVHNRWPN
jgi:KDO2-lipid IV(A) lauroyltransferase